MENQAGVFTTDFVQVFPDAYILKALVTQNSQAMQHPLETGATIIDHKILLPVEIELSIVLAVETYQETYEQIKQLYETSTQLLVQTKADTYENQILISIPHEENPATFNTITMSLHFRELLFVTATTQTIVPLNPAYTDTVARGQQPPTEPTPAQRTTGFKAFTNWLTPTGTLPELPPPPPPRGG
jgi:hypothetical protein